MMGTRGDGTYHLLCSTAAKKKTKKTRHLWFEAIKSTTTSRHFFYTDTRSLHLEGQIPVTHTPDELGRQDAVVQVHFDDVVPLQLLQGEPTPRRLLELRVHLVDERSQVRGQPQHLDDTQLVTLMQ